MNYINSKEVILLAGVAVVVILGGFVFFKDNFKTTTSNPISQASSRSLMDRMSYLDYSESNKVTSQKYGKTVLFFAATTWCHTCSALDKEIKERSIDIPSDITILKVDYDNDREMRTKYNITQQHTLILLDQNGSEEKRWIGGNFDLLLNELRET